MGSRVCYLSRSDLGGRIRAVRLVSERTDESWMPGALPSGALIGAPEAEAEARQAAAWVADRLRAADGENELTLLCLDAEGASCGWLTAPTSEPSVVAAAVAQRGGLIAGGGESVPGWSSVQALAEPPAGGGTSRPWLRRGRKAASEARAGERLAVIDVPDVSARHFVDALDDLGIVLGEAASIWHGAARAWDPAGPVADRLSRLVQTKGKPEEVVASVASVSAVVILDPAGRLIWAWSRAGSLLAGGTIRLSGEGQGTLRLDGADIGRLATDWLAWAAQIGCAPARIVCLGPDTEGSGGMTPAEIGGAIGKAWPGASVDLAVLADPIGATLTRLAEGMGRGGPGADESPRASMVALSRRPGRAHRAMYRWGAGLLVAGAAALGALAWQAYGAAERAAREAEETRAKSDEAITAALPTAGDPALLRMSLEAQVQQLRREKGPVTGLDPTRPILEELDALSLVLSDPAIEIDDIDLRTDIVLVRVLLPAGFEGTKQGEQLAIDLNEKVAGTSCVWQGKPGGPSRDQNKQSWELNGSWVAPAKGGGGGSAAPGGGA